MKKIVGWLVRVILFLILLLVIVVTSVTMLKIPIDLTRFKTPIEELASKALQRPVTIENSIIISTSLIPEFTLNGLRIKNPKGYDQDTFMYLGVARIHLKLLPLLQRKIHIPGIEVKKLHINLEENDNGDVNWVFNQEATKEEKSKPVKPQAPTETGGEIHQVNGDTLVVEKLELSDIAVTYYGPGDSNPSSYQIEECQGSMLPGTPMNLDINGKLLSFPYTLDIGIASFEEFLTENRSWMEITAEISKAKLILSGNINLEEAHKSLALKATVSGDNLDSLNELFQLDLPPLKSYSAAADLLLKNQSLNMTNLIVKTGTSSLYGSALIEKGKDKAVAELILTSPLFQLDDFIFEDWSWTGEETTEDADSKTVEETDGTVTEETENTAKTEPAEEKEKKLLDPSVLGKVDASLIIRSEKVLSGEDELGSGLLHVKLQEGRLAIEPLDLKVPGGSIKVVASLKPGVEQADASLKVDMKNFDIGILVRRSKPEAKMGGLVNLDVALESTAASFDQIMANGNGYFDFSGHLKNINAGIIDLWAVNLIAAIVSKTGENQSQINCAVGRWSVTDGLLKSDVLFIDTSKIRICGSGQVDFKKQYINLKIAPTPKKPEFFNLATPLKVKGTFAEIGVGLKTGALVGTSIKFITSPVIVPIRRIFSDNIPEDGKDACAVTLGPDNRSDSSVAGCK